MRGSLPILRAFVGCTAALRRVRYLVCALFGVFSVVGAAGGGVCENLSYGRVGLSVDSVEPAGAGLLKIELDGEAFLVSERDAARRVLLRMIKRDAWSQKLPFETFEIILREALTRNDEEVLRAAAIAGLKDIAYEDLNKEVIWREMLGTDVGRAALVGALRISGREERAERVCHVLMLMGQVGDSATHESLLNLRAVVSDQCLSASIDNVVKTLLVDGDVTGATRMLESARGVFAPVGESNAIKGESVARGLALVASAVESSNGDELAAAIAEVSRNVRDAGALFSKSARIEELFASTAIQRGKYRQLLSFLPSFDLQKRTTRIHESVLASVRGIGSDDYSVLADGRIVSAIAGFTGKDEEIRQAYREALERVVGALTDEGSFREADSIIEVNGSLIRPLSVTMRTIVVGIARGFMRRGDVAEASRVLREWLSPMPKLVELELLLRTHGVPAVGLLCVVLCCVVGAVWLSSVRLGSVWFGMKRDGSGIVGEESSQAAHSSGGSSEQSSVQGSQVLAAADEYASILQFFGLQHDATLTDIKRAYRLAVKECHPDLNQDGIPDARSMFIAITQRYERLMELRAKDEAVVVEV